MTKERKGPDEKRRAEPPQRRKRSREVSSPEHIEEALDEALAESFPASDPVSIATSEPEDAWQEERERENEPARDDDSPRDEGSRH